MKILFLSDIHGISDNLHYIEELESVNQFDKIVVLGDLYYTGPNYNMMQNSLNVFDFLMKYKDKMIILKGNCDSDVDIKATDIPISDLSLINVDNLDIYLTHGHLYSYSKNRKFDRNGILIYGHEHIPYIIKEKDMIYICVGSISLPRNNSKPSYLIYDNHKFTLYDINKNIIDEIEVYN